MLIAGKGKWHWNLSVASGVAALMVVVAAWPIVAGGQQVVSPDAEADAVLAAPAEPPPSESTGQGVIPEQNLFRIVQNGGPLMLPIVFCSFILLLFAFERTIALRRRRVIPRPFVKKFLHQLREGNLDASDALALCEEHQSPVANVFAAGIKKWGRPAVEVEQAILDAGERASNVLRKHLRLINGVATVSPLLGLLGTVVGMITAFNHIATADAMGRPELLAGGIGQALLTTAAGLTVAIPALIFYMFFTSRVDRLVMDIDALGQEVVAEISAEATVAATKTTRKKAA